MLDFIQDKDKDKDLRDMDQDQQQPMIEEPDLLEGKDSSLNHDLKDLDMNEDVETGSTQSNHAVE